MTKEDLQVIIMTCQEDFQESSEQLIIKLTRFRKLLDKFTKKKKFHYFELYKCFILSNIIQ